MPSIMRIVLIMSRPLSPLILVVLVAVVACAPGTPAGGRTIVATTSMWGDVVRSLDPDGQWDVEVLIPAGADPHDFVPSAAQVASLQRADLVVANGLGLEQGLDDSLRAAEADGARVLWLAPLLDPIGLAGGEGRPDPHVWLDPVRLGRAAGLIAAEMEVVAPSGVATAAAERFVVETEALRREIETTLAGVVDRRLFTNHDALGYFAERFGFEVVGTVVPGGSTVAEPSSRDIAALIEAIRAIGAPAIFVDAGVPHQVADAVADEFGGAVAIVELRTDSLAPSGEASTIIGLERLNAELIAAALGGG